MVINLLSKYCKYLATYTPLISYLFKCQKDGNASVVFCAVKFERQEFNTSNIFCTKHYERGLVYSFEAVSGSMYIFYFQARSRPSIYQSILHQSCLVWYLNMLNVQFVWWPTTQPSRRWLWLACLLMTAASFIGYLYIQNKQDQDCFMSYENTDWSCLKQMEKDLIRVRSFPFG